ncbi:hypothetical protein FLL45_00305 [Aliikangiella marina]|uniref:Uncharacterized protein n=1 Tax=Aliikangiella marina TaxID=1712262 RepID=A0A545TGU8_9GAMM|nr:hypothetical protein [Aliikangiella marina]TQV76443.1 hypothetical protein FLL45_00305 [Aliikangiella marina]
MREKELKLEASFDIAEFLVRGELIAFNTTHNRELVFAVAKKKLDYTDVGPGGTFPKIKSEEGQTYGIYYSTNNEIVHLTDIDNEFLNIHDVQLLPDYRILLVCCRCLYRGENDYDLNGRIYSHQGEFLDEILLGDGIQNVQTTKTGDIWTSYFDEGIFGNYGWNEPVGSSGLIAWNDKGEKQYAFEPRLGLDFMCDCYALNVESATTTWCYYYTEFPLAKIKNHELVNYWDIPLSGCDTFAIHQNYALFKGGYDDRDTLHLFKLSDNNVAKYQSRITLGNIKQIDLACARGDTIFILDGSLVYKIYVHQCL